MNLNNNRQITYTGFLYIGSNSSKNDVVFDTASGWLAVGTPDCQNCTLAKYDPTLSNTSILISNDSRTLSVYFLILTLL